MVRVPLIWFLAYAGASFTVQPGDEGGMPWEQMRQAASNLQQLDESSFPLLEANIARHRSRSFSDEDRERFLSDGHVKLSGLLGSELSDRLYELTLAAAAFDSELEVEGTQLFRVYGLLNRARTFRLLLEHPTILSAMSDALGFGYVMAGYTAYIVGAGSSKPGLLHMDGPSREARFRREALGAPVTVTALVYLNDASAENGATMVVEGSHLWTETSLAESGLAGGVENARNRATLRNFTVTSVEASKGTVLVLDGRLWHAAGPSLPFPTVTRPRVVLVLAFVIAEAHAFVGSVLLKRWVGGLVIPDLVNDTALTDRLD
jgi:hypothetical protein